MLPQSRLGRMRVTLMGLSAREFAEQIRTAGCSTMTLRRLRGIELGELRATPEERQAIAAALGARTWEVFCD